MSSLVYPFSLVGHQRAMKDFSKTTLLLVYVGIVQTISIQPGRTRSLVERWEQRERCINTDAPTTKSSSLMAEADTLRPSEKAQKESSGNDLIAPANEDATENLMQNHDSFISVLQSRLTKLQFLNTLAGGTTLLDSE
eukprot:TRINITY_DN6556_c0_g1_i15.p1 TRINITY_DN6556_c0_g1~~TRINITY_DN6556_c0_g1_i15.p1  ORF type:complete len:138 (+),score=23.62 TRINITY_DN6556_c0_g1_i15:192-605(+)